MKEGETQMNHEVKKENFILKYSTHSFEKQFPGLSSVKFDTVYSYKISIHIVPIRYVLYIDKFYTGKFLQFV